MSLLCSTMEAFTVQSPHSLLDDTFGTMMLSAEGDLHQRMRSPFAGVYVPKGSTSVIICFHRTKSQ
jgi:hypothetical protein